MSNHLGNVLVTVSDKKIGVSSNGTTIDYYTSDIITANDYYPFGSLMPGRKYSQPNTKYRYGFSGKENDNEVKGEGNQQDYGFRIYDPRLGRFLSEDPLANNYPWNSPYSYSEGDPVNYEDLDGLEKGGTRAAARLTYNRGALSNTVVNRQGRIVAGPVGPTNPPIIPPNAGANRVSGGWYVETPNGGYFVHDQNPFGPQPVVPKPDFRTQAEKDVEAAQLAFQYFKRDINCERLTPTNNLILITSNPSNLPDWYLKEAQSRLQNGKGSFNDQMLRDELVKRGMLSTRFGQAQELGKAASGDILGRNLERAGQVRLSVNHAAHHIVAGGDARAAGARKILAAAGIDINDAANGVFLETGSHRRMHTKSYYKKIEDRLRGAGTGNVGKELNKIRTEIKNGTF